MRQPHSKTLYNAINDKATNEEGNTNQVGQELIWHIKKDPSNYLVTSERNRSMPSIKHIDSVKKIIDLSLSLFSSPYSSHVQKFCSSEYPLAGGASFSRWGRVITVDQEGNILMVGKRYSSRRDQEGRAVILVLDKDLKEVTYHSVDGLKEFESHCEFNRKTGFLYLHLNAIRSVSEGLRSGFSGRGCQIKGDYYFDNGSIYALTWKGGELKFQWEYNISHLTFSKRHIWGYHKFGPSLSHLFDSSGQAFHVIGGLTYKWNSDKKMMEPVRLDWGHNWLNLSREEKQSVQCRQRIGISRIHTIAQTGELVFAHRTDYKGQERINEIKRIFYLNLRGEASNFVHIIDIAENIEALVIDSKNRILVFSRVTNEKAVCRCVQWRNGSKPSKQARVLWSYYFEYQSYRVGATSFWRDSPIVCDPRGSILIQTQKSLVSFNIYKENIAKESPIPEWEYPIDSRGMVTPPIIDPTGGISFLVQSGEAPLGNDNLRKITLTTIDPYDRDFNPTDPKPIRFLDYMGNDSLTVPTFDSEGRVHVGNDDIRGIASKYSWERIVIGAGAALLVLMIVAIWRRRAARRRAALTLRP